MKCAACGKEIEKSSTKLTDDFKIVDGVGITCGECCTEIGKRYGEQSSETGRGVVKALYMAAVVVFIMGFIMGMIAAGQYSAAMMICVWALTFISGMLFIGLGKIVDLLEEIGEKR